MCDCAHTGFHAAAICAADVRVCLCVGNECATSLVEESFVFRASLKLA